MIKKKNDEVSRRAVVWMAPSALIEFFKDSRWVITENHLPPDTIFIDCFWDARRSVWGIIVQSSKFKKVYAGHELPELKPVTFRHWNPKEHGIIE